ncbi:hypothetical protein EC988_007591, partial [Linderina pennispora]
MVLSDVILVLRSASKIASFAADECGRSVAQHLRTSSLVPSQVKVLVAATSERQTPPSTKLTSQLAARGVPVRLHPGRLDRKHLLRVFEQKPHRVGQTGAEEIRAADLSDIGLEFPQPPTEPATEPAQPTTENIKPVEVIEATTSAEPMQSTTEKEQQPTEYEGHLEISQKRQLQASAMPSNRVSRLYHYGSLAVGLGLGALGEATKRWSGFSDSSDQSSVMLSRANIDRIVDKLSKMRGAALKLGQMLSIQDSKNMTPEIAEILQRVQNAANYMPVRQLEKHMRRQLGADWRDKFAEFQDEPFAAASIGQVHEARIAMAEHGFSKV